MLVARELAFGFPARRVGSDVDFTLAAGESLAMLGGNGAGKTTLLRTLLGLLPPLAGRVEIDGVPIASLARRGARIAHRLRARSSTCPPMRSA